MAEDRRDDDTGKNVMSSKDLTRSRKIGEDGSGVLQYQYTGVAPLTGKDRKEAILYNRDKHVTGRNDIGFVK